MKLCAQENDVVGAKEVLRTMQTFGFAPDTHTKVGTTVRYNLLLTLTFGIDILLCDTHTKVGTTVVYNPRYPYTPSIQSATTPCTPSLSSDLPLTSPFLPLPLL